MNDFLTHILIPLLMCPAILGSFLWVSCCCTPSCTFFTDNFNRSDDDDPGAYTEVSGDWDISSNKLVTSSSNGVLIADAEHPDGEPNIKVSVTVNIATSGDTARIILDYVDSNNYWFAEVKAGTGAYLRIYQRASGSNTQKAQNTAAISTGSITLCAAITNSSIISASISGGGSTGSTGSFSSNSWGLGSGAISGTLQFSTASAAVTSPTCSACDMFCEDLCTDDKVASSYKVVITGITGSFCSTGDCSGYDGTYYIPMGNDSATSCSGTGDFTALGFPCAFANRRSIFIDIEASSGPRFEVSYDISTSPGAIADTDGVWRISDPPNKIECLSLNNETMTLVTAVNGLCNVSTATVKVTSIP